MFAVEARFLRTQSPKQWSTPRRFWLKLRALFSSAIEPWSDPLEAKTRDMQRHHAGRR